MKAPKSVTAGEFSLVFAVFAVLTLWAMLTPVIEGVADIGRGRTLLSVWVFVILLAPALVLYLFKSFDQRILNLSALFWTAAWLAFLVHAYFAIFVRYDGIAETYAERGIGKGLGDILVTVVFTLDVILLWMLPARLQSLIWQWFARLFAFGVIIMGTIILSSGRTVPYGIAFIAIVAVAACVRIGLLINERLRSHQSTRSLRSYSANATPRR